MTIEFTRANSKRHPRSSPVTLSCVWCLKSFMRPAHAVRKQAARGCVDAYCSAKCTRAHHAIKNAPRCVSCARPMPGRRGRLYCSRECKPVHRTLEDRACEHCKVKFRPKSHQAVCCSRQCADALHALRMGGRQNPNFKHGKSYSKAYNVASVAARQRDLHRCRACGVAEQRIPQMNGGRMVLTSTLVVHHHNEDTTDNRLENLSTICKACHQVHHKSKPTPFPWLAQVG